MTRRPTAELGVFARVFPPGSAQQVSAEIAAAGFTVTQLNLAVLGRPTLDDQLTPMDAAAVGEVFAAAGVRIWSVSATFNAIDPDAAQREHAIAAAQHLIDVAAFTGAQVVTLCTGTLDPQDMWRAHPGNNSPAAWRALLTTLEQLLPHAAAAGVRLGIEPEPANVVADASGAVRLLNELGESASLVAIVLDPANLVTVQTADQQDRILRQAFESLGPHVVGLHAKDVAPGGFAAPGTGVLDYDLVADLYSTLPQPVPVIAQDLDAAQAPEVLAFLSRYWSPAGRR